MRVCLRRRRRVWTHRGSQVAEARHRDRPHTVLRQRAREGHALVVPAAAAVDHQQRHAGTKLLILDGAAARGSQHAALRGTGLRVGQIPLKSPSDQHSSKLRAITLPAANFKTLSQAN